MHPQDNTQHIASKHFPQRPQLIQLQHLQNVLQNQSQSLLQPHFTQHSRQSMHGWHLIPQHVIVQSGHQDSFGKNLSPGETFSDLAK